MSSDSLPPLGLVPQPEKPGHRMAQEQPSASNFPFDLKWPDPESRAELDWLMVGLETVARVLMCWETLSPHLDPGLQDTKPQVCLVHAAVACPS